MMMSLRNALKKPLVLFGVILAAACVVLDPLIAVLVGGTGITWLVKTFGWVGLLVGVLAAIVLVGTGLWLFRKRRLHGARAIE